MAHASETLERAEHTAHAGHGHGGHDANPLPMRIGITMAILGVLLTITAARVGYERTELVQYLVEQQHAHAKYQAQDVKHRTAVLTLQQLHAFAGESKVNPNDMVAIAKSVERYLEESKVAQTWVDAYDPMIAAHSEAQEEYEHAELAAELGVVIASIALLLRRKSAWLLAIMLGALAVGLVGKCYLHTGHVVAEAEEKIDESEKHYHALREANKTTDVEKALVDEVLKTYATKGSPAKATDK
jgi:hypothetical protein